MILSSIDLWRALTGIGSLLLGLAMVVWHKRIGDWGRRWRFRWIGKVGAPDEFFKPDEADPAWRLSAIVAGSLLLVFAVFNFMTAWS